MPDHDDPSAPVPEEASRPGMRRRTVLQIAGSGAALAAAIVAVRQLHSSDGHGGVGVAPGEPARIALTVNGENRELEIDPRQSLLDVLRERLDLTGSKKGCNQGACGACTVLVDDTRVLACLTLAVMLDGAAVTTIEGLANGDELHPLQAAFIDREGLQCGFCTPGQILSGVGCIAEGHAGSPEEIKFWMSGNICRCAAYPGIVAAVADVAEKG